MPGASAGAWVGTGVIKADVPSRRNRGPVQYVPERGPGKRQPGGAYRHDLPSTSGNKAQLRVESKIVAMIKDPRKWVSPKQCSS